MKYKVTNVFGSDRQIYGSFIILKANESIITERPPPEEGGTWKIEKITGKTLKEVKKPIETEIKEEINNGK